MIKKDVRQTQNLTNTTKIDPNLRKIDKEDIEKKDKNRLIAQKQTELDIEKKTKID